MRDSRRDFNFTTMTCNVDNEFPFNFNSIFGNGTKPQSTTWKELINNYDRLIFSGDSILHQSFQTFLCMLDPRYGEDPRYIISNDRERLPEAMIAATYPPSNMRVLLNGTDSNWYYGPT